MAYHRTSSIKPKTNMKIPPGPLGHFFWGNLRDIRANRLLFLMNMFRLYGRVVQFRLAHLKIYQVNDPEGIKHILQDNHRNYTNQVMGLNTIRLVVGNGLVTSDGEYWLKQRRLVQPFFHHEYINDFSSHVTTKTLDLIQQWEKHINSLEPVDIAVEMHRLTLSIIMEFLFSTDIRPQIEKILQAVTTLGDEVSFRFDKPFYPPLWIPTHHNRVFLSSLNIIDKVIYGLINSYRYNITTNNDLLHLLISARDSITGEQMRDEQIRDEVVTLTNAGHGTTANALTWGLYLLSTHPEVANKLRVELEMILGSRVPSVADLPNLTYLRNVTQEVLRLYPPVWLIPRKSLADDEVCGYFIPANSTVIVSPYVTHRDPNLWLNPEVFDPDRFLEDAQHPKYAYFPFGGGPRLCLGKDFAITEIQLILASLLQKYNFILTPEHIVEPQALGGLRTRYGLLMNITHRIDRS